MKTLILLLSCMLTNSAGAAAGGGSSGVGNHITIVPGLESNVARKEAYKKSGNVIFDAKTGEKLIKIEHLKKSDINRYQGKLVNSHLGAVSGYEYLPDYSEKARDNFWVICLKGDDCIRLIPESDTNSKVQAIVGGLQKSK
jgi:hypothetical protein